MSAPPFMPLYVADYFGDTRKLSTEQHGAYLLLLMSMWRSDGSLPADAHTLARVTGLTIGRWRKISPDVLAFFDVVDGRLTHGRLEKELIKAQLKSDARAEAGARGGHAKALKTKRPTPAIAIELPEQKPSPALASSQNSESKNTDANASVVPKRGTIEVWDDAFQAGWEAYPLLGRQRSCSRRKLWPIWREAAQLAGGPEKLVAAVKRYVAEDKTHKGDCGAPAFDRWLKAGRWEHFLDGLATPRLVSVFPDETIRNAVIRAKDEAWAASWLDPCGWDGERRVIIPRTSLAATRLRAEVIRVLAASQVSIQEMQA